MAGDSEVPRESSADARDPQQVQPRFGRSHRFSGPKSRSITRSNETIFAFEQFRVFADRKIPKFPVSPLANRSGNKSAQDAR
jgi:hypothetical protein